MSAELSAVVSASRVLLLYRDNQKICYHLFQADEIAVAINYIYVDVLFLKIFICARVCSCFGTSKSVLCVILFFCYFLLLFT